MRDFHAAAVRIWPFTSTCPHGGCHWDRAPKNTDLVRVSATLRPGHLLDMSPKLHPEIAGVGIEYCWAVAKQEFRCENDFSVKTLSPRVQHALKMLTLPVIRKCARRARDYERAYRALDDGSGTELQHKQIEQMKKEVKRHRDALKFSEAWAAAERQAERARRGAGGQ